MKLKLNYYSRIQWVRIVFERLQARTLADKTSKLNSTFFFIKLLLTR